VISGHRGLAAPANGHGMEHGSPHSIPCRVTIALAHRREV